jgi:hypothetical protein
MAHSSKETLSIGWCDNGLTDGKFTEGLVYTMITAPTRGVSIHNAIRVQGNQIGRQRQALFAMWLDQIKTDWLLWVDSDIVLTADVLKLLWDTADKIQRPVVCGVYFISKETESSLMMPMPAVFNETGEEYSIKYLHPLPKNEVVQVDNAGLGLTLMHRSTGLALREKFGDVSMFAEIENVGDKFIGEDIVFFRKLKAAGIKVHAHTGARVKHMKRFSFDENYYSLYWKTAEAMEQAKKGINDAIITKEQQA